MKLTLVRHGRTGSNDKGLSGKVQGMHHGRLTKKGIEQAEKLAKRLKNEEFDFIYSSDMTRAKQTTTLIIKYNKKTPIIHSDMIREVNGGVFIGGPRTRFHEARKRWCERKRKKWYVYRPEKGESVLDAYERTKKVINYFLDYHKKDSVLAVGHGQFFQLFILAALKEPIQKIENFFLKNTSVSVFDFKKKNARLLELNDFEHLMNAKEKKQYHKWHSILKRIVKKERGEKLMYHTKQDVQVFNAVTDHINNYLVDPASKKVETFKRNNR